MGTRHLTVVFLNGTHKIAQYGQWDGYPTGQGLTVLNFVKKIRKGENLEVFKEKVRSAEWITQEDIDNINAEIKAGKIKKWIDVYPELHRDMGAGILDHVFKSDPGMKLRDDFDFAFDHVFCEYIWALDLDKNVFGLYEGKDETHTIEPIKTWLINFPPTEDEFLEAFGEDG